MEEATAPEEALNPGERGEGMAALVSVAGVEAVPATGWRGGMARRPVGRGGGSSRRCATLHSACDPSPSGRYSRGVERERVVSGAPRFVQHGRRMEGAEGVRGRERRREG